MKYLLVKNWEEHQHYKNRSPAWIKLHRAVLDDYAFCSLSDVTKAHLLLIWLLASQSGGKVPYDAAFVGNKIGAQEPVDLEAIVAAGFLIPHDGAVPNAGVVPEAGRAAGVVPVAGTEINASVVLATCEQDASKLLCLEEKRREETEKSVRARPRVRRSRTQAEGPTPEHVALAGQLGLNCAAEWAEMWDRVEAKGKPWFADADAAFRNWLRQAHKYAVRDGTLRNAVGQERRVAL